jgi:hypothetical protein
MNCVVADINSLKIIKLTLTFKIRLQDKIQIHKETTASFAIDATPDSINESLFASVMIIATGSDELSVNSLILAGGVLDTMIHIPNLTRDDKVKIFNSIIFKKIFRKDHDVSRNNKLAMIISNESSDEIASLDTATANDLQVVAAYCIHEASIRMTATFTAAATEDLHISTLNINDEDVHKAIQRWRKLSTREVGAVSSLDGDMNSSKSKDWSCIGGLQQLQAHLKEVFELPIKYSKLFRSSPLTLPRGVLLFGPPGNFSLN